jgi:hypothetical protein
VSYCDFAHDHPVHGPYHDNEYGFPVRNDDALFERLVLEINQAGLSWETIKGLRTEKTSLNSVLSPQVSPIACAYSPWKWCTPFSRTGE